MKLLKLTGVGEVLKEEVKEQDGVPRCDNGKTREFYEDLGVPEERIPQELKEREQDINIFDDDDSYEEVYSKVGVYYKDILLMIKGDKTTTIFIRNSDLTLSVKETIEDIETLSLNWFGRLKIKINRLINREK